MATIMDKLRVGVILPEAEAPLWVVRIFEQVRASEYAEIVAVIFAHDRDRDGSLANRFHRFHFQLDRRVFRPTPDPWERTDIWNIIPDARFLEGGLNDGDSRLEALRLDVLLDLSPVDIPASLASMPAYGIWSLHCNNARVTVHTSFGWLELSRGEPLISCGVEARRGNSFQVIAKSVAAADPRSFTQNQKTFLWRSASLIPRALRLLRSQGGEKFFAQAETVSPAVKIPPPALVQTIMLAMKQAFIFLRNKFMRRQRMDRWALMTRKGSGADPLSWNGFRLVVPPRSAFWADPFMVERQGRIYIFFEEFVYKTGLGRISYAEVREDGGISAPLVALERQYHLSYPFIFEHRGAYYMIPETAEKRAIEMYRCARFPDLWEFHKTIRNNVQAVDTTLLEHDGLWWMFVNIAGEGGSTWDELHLFYANDPLSDHWTSHPLNPVVSDVRSARPAGRIFLRDGRLMRPSQDSSLQYGYALNLNRINRLTKTEYQEELIERLEPPKDGNILAVHTYNFAGNLIAVDVNLKG